MDKKYPEKNGDRIDSSITLRQGPVKHGLCHAMGDYLYFYNAVSHQDSKEGNFKGQAWAEGALVAEKACVLLEREIY